jgi:hypothetical protein
MFRHSKFFLILATLVLTAVSVHAETTPAGTIPVVTLDSTPQPAAKPVKKTVIKKPVAVKKTTTTTVTTPPPAAVVATPVEPSPAPTPTATKTKKTKTLKTTKVAKAPKQPKPVKILSPKQQLKEKDLTAKNSNIRNKVDGMHVLSLSGTAFLDFGSEEGMYLDAADKAAIVATGATVSSITAGGLGLAAAFEYGFSDRISGTVSVNYDRLTYANKFRTLVTESFFGADVTANYYVLRDPKRVMPYVSGGAGVVAGSTKVLPTLDLGGGAQFFVSDSIAIKAQLLVKTAFIFNRLEPSLGVAYHF